MSNVGRRGFLGYLLALAVPWPRGKAGPRAMVDYSLVINEDIATYTARIPHGAMIFRKNMRVTFQNIEAATLPPYVRSASEIATSRAEDMLGRP